MSNGAFHRDDHIAVLDGLRGVAAFAVMVLHFGLSLGLIAMPKAYLAVDFFFLLSGFVVALAYGERLSRPGFVAGFARLRFIRLYPLIPLGMILGFMSYTARNVLSPDKTVDPVMLVTALGFSLVLLPFGRVPGATENSDFPFDGAMWSLMFEAIINILYAAIGPFLRNIVLAVLVLASAAGMIVACQHWGMIHHGFEKDEFAYGMLRVTFPFFAGVGLCRLYRAGKLSVPGLNFWFLAAALFATFIPIAASVPRLYDMACITLVYPLILAGGLTARLTRGSRKVALALGRLSYPLYVLHAPFVMVTTFLYNRFPLSDVGRWAVLAGGCAAASIFAWLALIFFDEPVRAWLRGPTSPFRRASARA